MSRKLCAAACELCRGDRAISDSETKHVLMAITDLAGQDRLQLDCNCMNLVPRVAYSGGGKSEYRQKHEKGKKYYAKK